MIYTLTLNPSIDYIVGIDEFVGGKTLRSTFEKKYPGGKGIMVSKLLKNLGERAINIGFLGGFTGDFIKRELDRLNILHNFTEISDDSRINIKLKYGQETEINAEGPEIREVEKVSFLDQIDDLSEDDFIIISGSIPKSLGDDFYKIIINILDTNNIRFALDTNGKKLYELSSYKPFLVKPNKDELADIFNVSIESEEDIIKYAKKFLDKGAENVIVSLGAKGSLFIDKNLLYKSSPIKGDLINSVGCGDSMLGAYIYGYMNGLSKLESYKLAVAAATATAFSADIADKKSIYEMIDKVEVEELK